MPIGSQDFLELYGFDPRKDTIFTKFKLGDDQPPFCDIEKFTPLFGFDYISLSKTDFCFNNSALTTSDYKKLIGKLKELSQITYTDIHDAPRTGHRFHQINILLKNQRFLADKFKNLLSAQSLSDDEIPELYQFEVYTDVSTNKAPRVIGFIGKLGVFFILWLDYDHKTYQAKD